MLLVVMGWLASAWGSESTPMTVGTAAGRSPEAFATLVQRVLVDPTNQEDVQALAIAALQCPVNWLRPDVDPLQRFAWRLDEASDAGVAALLATQEQEKPEPWLAIDILVAVGDEDAVDELAQHLGLVLSTRDCGKALAALQQIERRLANIPLKDPPSSIRMPVDALRALTDTTAAATTPERVRMGAIRLLEAIEKREQERRALQWPAAAEGNGPAPTTALQKDAALAIGAARRASAAVEDHLGRVGVYLQRLRDLDERTLPQRLARWRASGSWVKRTRTILRQSSMPLVETFTNPHHPPVLAALKSTDDTLDAVDESLTTMSGLLPGLDERYQELLAIQTRIDAEAGSDPMLADFRKRLVAAGESLQLRAAEATQTVRGQRELQIKRRQQHWLLTMSIQGSIQP